MLMKSMLIEFLSHTPELEVRLSTGEEIKHMSVSNGVIILGTSSPIAFCNKCGENAFKEMSDDYVGYCPNCDENLYEFEMDREGRSEASKQCK